MISIKSLFIITFFLLIPNSDFLNEQKNYPRVRQAITQKLESIQHLFKQKNVSFPPQNIYIRAFKNDQKVELWARSSKQDSFKSIKKYTFCSSSGELGPKRKQGDLQIPEGYYYIDRFNPNSNFHLSLGINYPNESDRLLGKKESLGGDIFIHGDCVTIGCIPITDELIKELYVIALYTKNNGQQKIPVHIFPTRMTNNNLAKLKLINPKNMAFWNNLGDGYSYFEKHRLIPDISVDRNNGTYILNE